MIFPIMSFGQNKCVLSDSVKNKCHTDSVYCLSKDSLCCSKKDNKEPIMENTEVSPKFPGGEMNYLRRNFKFPQETIDAGIVSGRIVVSFIVEKDGSLSDVRVVSSSFDEHFNKKYVSTIKNMPKWKPGTNKGMAVRTKMVLPINYDYR